MLITRHSLLFMLTCAIIGGCSPLARYIPSGSSAAEDLDISLARSPYCFREYPDDSLDEAEKARSIDAYIWRETAQRVRYPSFRSLCALLNGYFGRWDRMLVLEMIATGPGVSDFLGRYGFIAAAVRGTSVRAVTNIHWDYVGWNAGMQLFDIRPDGNRLRNLMSELDRAASSLPPAVVFDDRALDVDLFTLHWIERDKYPWSCALYTANAYWQVTGVSRPARSAPHVSPAELMRTEDRATGPWRSVAIRDKNAFDAVSGVYGDLMRRLWVSAMGEPKIIPSLFGTEASDESPQSVPNSKGLFGDLEAGEPNREQPD